MGAGSTKALDRQPEAANNSKQAMATFDIDGTMPIFHQNDQPKRRSMRRSIAKGKSEVDAGMLDNYVVCCEANSINFLSF